MYYVYAIKSRKDHRIYVGITNDLKTRLKDHNAGRTRSTAPYKPWVLFYFKEYETRLLARAKEKKLKSGFGKEYLKQLAGNVPVAQLDRAFAF